jgi:hypothetical protein
MMPTNRQIASQRSWSNRHSPTHDGVLGDPARIDQDGVMGEKTFAELFKIPQDEIVRDHRVAYNFRLQDGTKVDVRASRAKEASLIIDPKVLVKSDADVFVLVQLDKEATKGRVIGWATRKEVESAPTTTMSDRPGATRVHRLRPYQLRDIDTLMIRHVPMTKRLPL